MHGLVDADHVDHLHPDSGIALATAADGEALTKECFGDRVVWVPWRRPGFQLGLDIAAVQRDHPAAIGVHPRRPRHHRVGPDERRVRGELARDHPHRRGVHRRAGRAEPFGADRPRVRAAPAMAERRARAAALAPIVPRPGVDRPGAGRATSPTTPACSTSSPARSSPAWPGSARRAPTTSCAPRSARSCSTCPPTPPLEDVVAASRELHAAYRERLSRLLRAPRRAGLPADARRRPGDRAGARRRHVLLRRGQADGARRRRSSTSTPST